MMVSCQVTYVDRLVIKGSSGTEKNARLYKRLFYKDTKQGMRPYSFLAVHTMLIIFLF